MPNDLHTSDRREPDSGLSRRGLLRSAAGIGAATVAAGLLADALATPASAAGTPAEPQPAEPMVAHVKDVRAGEIDLFVGTRHLNFRSPEIAALLAREL
jgi:hypothetical protein